MVYGIAKHFKVLLSSVLLCAAILCSFASNTASSQTLSFTKDDTSIQANAKFESVGYVSISHDKFMIPVMDQKFLQAHTFRKTASVQVHGAPGERGQLSCRYVRKSVSTALPCGQSSFAKNDPSLITGEESGGEVELSGSLIAEAKKPDSFIFIGFLYI